MPSVIPALVLNTSAWTVLAFGAGWWHRRTPVDQLGDDGPILRLRKFEQSGQWYANRLRIKSWKVRLPETGGRHGGMSKRTLPGARKLDLERFSAECRRGERTHWTIIVASPTFALWNSPSAVVAISIANAAGNSPFIAVLRYNRARITEILGRQIDHPDTRRHDACKTFGRAALQYSTETTSDNPAGELTTPLETE